MFLVCNGRLITRIFLQTSRYGQPGTFWPGDGEGYRGEGVQRRYMTIIPLGRFEENHGPTVTQNICKIN